MRRKNIPEDFWKKVNKQTESGCWEWIGALSNGYGSWGIDHKIYLTHRYSMILAGYDLQDFDVLHKCDNTKCVNPDHLFLGTHTENMRDMVSKGRHKSPTTGKPRTDEDKEKIRNANIGKVKSEEHKQKIAESVRKTLLNKRKHYDTSNGNQIYYSSVGFEFNIHGWNYT
jgi:hypothetical protein